MVIKFTNIHMQPILKAHKCFITSYHSRYVLFERLPPRCNAEERSEKQHFQYC